MPCSLDSLLDVAKRLRLTPMIRYAIELEQDVTTANLSHAEYLAKLLHCECERRDEEALKRRLQQANFRYADACIARVDWNADRQINRSLLDTLASNDYIRFHQNVIITGATVAARLGWLTRLDTQLAWPDSELSTIAWLRCSRNTSVYALKTRQSAADSICRAWGNLIY